MLLRSGGKKKIEKNSNLVVAHHLLGGPLVTEKNIGFEFFFGIFFNKWFVIWQGSLKYFSKFHHTHEHEQSPRHQQGLIGLIW